MISKSSSVVGSHSMSSGIGSSGASMWPSGEPKTLSQLIDRPRRFPTR